ncbi:MAG: Xaa-Pro peptidase family protein [Oscillospiraceae bacterium]|jgi:Xaa-Pro aminopeptidase|nr:Xaa-Pro peptidase family protein [Oscillospiraceae bacterium]
MKPAFAALPTRQELESRIDRLRTALDARDDAWDAALVVDKVNQYYLTGTMQDGLFLLKRDGAFAYFARKSFQRARQESPLPAIYPMTSYREVAQHLGPSPMKVYLEKEVVTCAMFERLQKHLPLRETAALDGVIGAVRAVKSAYELTCMEASGRAHAYLLETVAPSLMREGMSEAELAVRLYEAMVALGHHGVTRFARFQTDVALGQVAFGENTIYPSNFYGPGGMKGLCPAAPLLGDSTRRLQKGDIVYLDVGFGVQGYHTDRSQAYCFGAAPSSETLRLHRACLALQKQIAARLKPGAVPHEIYACVTADLGADFRENFMGVGGDCLKFLGHGVGLYVDEIPALAPGFHEPLAENMTFAVEPKKSVPGVGLLGGEDTYLVTPDGGRCLTGGEKDILMV